MATELYFFCSLFAVLFLQSNGGQLIPGKQSYIVVNYSIIACTIILYYVGIISSLQLMVIVLLHAFL